MPPNNSATGGLLFPGPGRYAYDFSLVSDPAYWSNSHPADGDRLDDLLQKIVRLMTGLPGDLVRPLWQPEPPPIPSHETDWIALGVVDADLDPGFAWEWTELPPAPLPVDAEGNLLGTFMIQHEIFELKCVFYGPHSDWYDSLVRDGFAVGQNRELLFLAGMGLVNVGSGVLVPEYIQSRWWRRIDRSIRIHREIRRLYPILEIKSIPIRFIRDTGQSAAIVPAPPPSKVPPAEVPVVILPPIYVSVRNVTGGPVTQVLPLVRIVDQAVVTTDVIGNAAQFPITVVDPEGALINGASSVVIDEDFGSVTLVWTGTAYIVTAIQPAAPPGPPGPPGPEGPPGPDSGGGGTAIQYIDAGTSHSIPLADGVFDTERVGISDNLRVASNTNPIIISGNLTVGAAIAISFPGGSYEFVWSAAQGKWRVF